MSSRFFLCDTISPNRSVYHPLTWHGTHLSSPISSPSSISPPLIFFTHWCPSSPTQGGGGRGREGAERRAVTDPLPPTFAHPRPLVELRARALNSASGLRQMLPCQALAKRAEDGVTRFLKRTAGGDPRLKGALLDGAPSSLAKEEARDRESSRGL